MTPLHGAVFEIWSSSHADPGTRTTLAPLTGASLRSDGSGQAVAFQSHGRAQAGVLSDTALRRRLS